MTSIWLIDNILFACFLLWTGTYNIICIKALLKTENLHCDLQIIFYEITDFNYFLVSLDICVPNISGLSALIWDLSEDDFFKSVQN